MSVCVCVCVSLFVFLAQILLDKLKKSLDLIKLFWYHDQRGNMQDSTTGDQLGMEKGVGLIAIRTHILVSIPACCCA